MITRQKLWLFHLKSSFHSWDIQIFASSSSPLLPPVSHYFRGWLKTNLKVYNFINYSVLEKYFKRLKDPHLKHRLFFLAFGLNQLIEKLTRSTLHTMSLVGHISTNSKGKLEIMGSFLMEYQTMTLFTVPGKQKC